MLVIEIDGEVHRYIYKQDDERSRILKDLGLSVYRIKNEEIEMNGQLVLKKLSLFLESRKHTHG